MVVGLLFLTWLATSSMGCTVGADRSKMASMGESCASKACAVPASCVDTREGPRCHVVCQSAGKSNCPNNMICGITNDTSQYICVKDPDASLRWIKGY